MNLFAADPAVNLLPADGVANYHGVIIGTADQQRFFERLLADVPWQQDEAVIFGRRIVTSRKVAWHGDADYAYTYSGSTKHALPWTSELRELKALTERASGATYNTCLLNLYHHGGEGMGWHSDDEKMLVANAAIASISLGAERKFCLKHKRDPERKVSVVLESGSLLVMKDETQTHWLHSLPKSKKITVPRINLTFRTIVVR